MGSTECAMGGLSPVVSHLGGAHSCGSRRGPAQAIHSIGARHCHRRAHRLDREHAPAHRRGSASIPAFSEFEPVYRAHAINAPRSCAALMRTAASNAANCTSGNTENTAVVRARAAWRCPVGTSRSVTTQPKRMARRAKSRPINRCARQRIRGSTWLTDFGATAA